MTRLRKNGKRIKRAERFNLLPLHLVSGQKKFWSAQGCQTEQVGKSQRTASVPSTFWHLVSKTGQGQLRAQGALAHGSFAGQAVTGHGRTSKAANRSCAVRGASA